MMASDSFGNFSPERYFAVSESPFDHITDRVDETPEYRPVFEIKTTDNRSKAFIDAVTGAIDRLPWQAPSLLALEGYRAVVGKTLPTIIDQVVSPGVVSAKQADLEKLKNSYTTLLTWQECPGIEQNTVAISSNRQHPNGQNLSLRPDGVDRVVSSAMAYGVFHALRTDDLNARLNAAYTRDMTDQTAQASRAKFALDGFQRADAQRLVGENILTGMWNAPARSNIPGADVYPAMTRIAEPEVRNLWSQTVETLSLSAAAAYKNRAELISLPASIEVSRLRL